jgi:hypothetical protein
MFSKVLEMEDTMSKEAKKTRTFKGYNGETVVQILEIPQTFDHQILLYAKHWYKRSEDGIFADLITLLTEYSGCEPSLGDVKECLCSCWAKYCPEHMRVQSTEEMLGWSWRNSLMSRTPEQVMIGALSITKGNYVDTDELLPVLVKSKEDFKGSFMEDKLADDETADVMKTIKANSKD